MRGRVRMLIAFTRPILQLSPQLCNKLEVKRFLSVFLSFDSSLWANVGGGANQLKTAKSVRIYHGNRRARWFPFKLLYNRIIHLKVQQPTIMQKANRWRWKKRAKNQKNHSSKNDEWCDKRWRERSKWLEIHYRTSGKRLLYSQLTQRAPFWPNH